MKVMGLTGVLCFFGVISFGYHRNTFFVLLFWSLSLLLSWVYWGFCFYAFAIQFQGFESNSGLIISS